MKIIKEITTLTEAKEQLKRRMENLVRWEALAFNNNTVLRSTTGLQLCCNREVLLIVIDYLKNDIDLLHTMIDELESKAVNK